MKKILALTLCVCFGLTALGGCARQPDPAPAPGGTGSPNPGGESASGSVYFLNFKPEIADQYAALAAAYTAETGVPVKIETAASGMYEQTLMSEMGKKDAPTIFQLNGPVGYESWEDYCLDLSGSEFYSMLSDPNLAIRDDGGVYGIPYVVEGYGILCNMAILDKYFALPDSAADSMEEINNFAALKAVVEDMQARKEELGIEGVFASTSLSAGNQWRWQSHLANLPFYFEFLERDENTDPTVTGLDADEVLFSYSDNFKNIFDLYVNNSTTGKAMLGAKSVDDAMAEFALGRCAMVQNGNWAASQILGVEGNTVREEDIEFLPIYIGVPGEENQGLCIGTENYLAVNRRADPEDQRASLDFLAWMFSSETGKQFALTNLGVTPFNTFGADELPADPLGREVVRWMNKEGVESVPWAFLSFPSDAFKNYFGDALLEYVQGNRTWDEVVSIVRARWASEREAAD